MSEQAHLVHVVAAAIFNVKGQVLIAKRQSHQHQGGLWEFPGGKVEEDESVIHALRRELWEEVGVKLNLARPLIQIVHHYPDKSVLLDVWRTDGFNGVARGLEGQTIEWVELDQLSRRDFPAANLSIVRAVRLPDHYLITPEPSLDPAFLKQLEKQLKDGVRLFQLRSKTLTDEQLGPIAEQIYNLAEQYGANMLLNIGRENLAGIPCHGLHLTSQQLAQRVGRPVPDNQWLGASIHNERELRQAEAVGCDFVLASPVFKTLSHPDATPLQWEGFQTLCEAASIPVYGLGGLTLAERATAFRFGGQGIAGIRTFFPSSAA